MMELTTKILHIANQQGIDSVDFEKDVLLFDDGDGQEIREWNLDIPLPGEGALAIAEDEINTENDAVAYVALRISAYPSIGDQLDMQFHDKLDGTTTWTDSISAIKEQYPKP